MNEVLNLLPELMCVFCLIKKPNTSIQKRIYICKLGWLQLTFVLAKMWLARAYSTSKKNSQLLLIVRCESLPFVENTEMKTKLALSIVALLLIKHDVVATV
jgi:hypothetical protein